MLPWEPRWPLSGAMSSSLMTEDQCPETWLWFVSVLCLPQSGWCCSLDTLHPGETKPGGGNTSTHRGCSCLIKYIGALTGQAPDFNKVWRKTEHLHQSGWYFNLTFYFHAYNLHFEQSEWTENTDVIGVLLCHKAFFFFFSWYSTRSFLKQMSWKTTLNFQSKAEQKKIKHHNSCLTGNVSFWRKKLIMTPSATMSLCGFRLRAHIQTGAQPVHSCIYLFFFFQI